MREITYYQAPVDGSNFLEIHTFEGVLWAQTYRYNEDSNLESYCEAQDRWFETQVEFNWENDMKRLDRKFYIAE